MVGLNKAVVMGRMGDEPEMRFTPSGAAVVNFSLATSRKFKDHDGQMVEETEWHRIVCWNKLAERINEMGGKGKLVYIEGRITNREWEDKDGNMRKQSEIVANNVIILSPKDSDKPAAIPAEKPVAKKTNSKRKLVKAAEATEEKEPDDVRF